MSVQITRKPSLKRVFAMGCAVAALATVSLSADAVLAQQGNSKQAHGAQSGAGGSQGQGGQMGQGSGGSKGHGGIFRDITGMGPQDSGRSDPVESAEEGDDDSDKPTWAGQPGGKDGAGGGQPSNAGSTKGDLFGDLWVILRDDNGVPILTSEGWVQPIDENGDPIPLDEEGMPIDETATMEVELGRLNVGRAPSKVLQTRADEVITLLNSATDLTVDAAGRLVLTVDGEAKTIDSPLENLAIYVALLTQGTIPGVTDLPGTEFDFMVDGTYTLADLEASAAFLAAATDKSGEFTSDEIAYIDAFLGINTTTVGEVTYSVIDYSTFSYDRSDTYDGVMATVLVEQEDGSFKPETVDVYDAVFGDENGDGVDASASGSLDAYTLAADDARMVIEFIHEYAVPESLE